MISGLIHNRGFSTSLSQLGKTPTPTPTPTPAPALSAPPISSFFSFSKFLHPNHNFSLLQSPYHITMASTSSLAFSLLSFSSSSNTDSSVSRLSSRTTSTPLNLKLRRGGANLRGNGNLICASVSSPAPAVSLSQRTPDELAASIVSQVMETDRGVKLTREQHTKVAELAGELNKFCVDAPVKCPLIFGEWDVLYCSNPTSPGGGFRSGLGRLVFRTNEMIQAVEAPDIVRNKVSFSALGFIDGELSLRGKLTALDEKWIRVVFEQPELKIGSLEFRFGGESEVQLEITYIDEKMRLGKGSRSSLFVFQRR